MSETEKCRCYKCCFYRDKSKFGDDLPYMAFFGSPLGQPETSYFIVCAKCGNKRCPHGTDHALACTGSNESGQTGSRYA
jgi:hypothetical protein